MAILEEKLDQVRKLEEKLAELNKKLMITEETKKRLEDEVDLCSSKLIQAEKLIGNYLVPIQPNHAFCFRSSALLKDSLMGLFMSSIVVDCVGSSMHQVFSLSLLILIHYS